MIGGPGVAVEATRGVAAPVGMVVAVEVGGPGVKVAFCRGWPAEPVTQMV